MVKFSFSNRASRDSLFLGKFLLLYHYALSQPVTLVLHSVITVGPSFKLNAQAIATLDINLGLTADLAYKVDNTRLFFPPQNGLESKGNAKAEDTR